VYIIELDDETYEFLRRNNDIGEQVLRRLLHIPPYDGRNTSADADGKAPNNSEDSRLRQFLNAQQLETSRDATDRYLQILAFAHHQKQATFDRVLSIPSGRKRVYFARSEEEIARSGTSTHPRQIPESNFWALTNLGNEDKGKLLFKALRLVGYGSAVAKEASRRLA
jgi:negative modulator of initiation of replication